MFALSELITSSFLNESTRMKKAVKIIKKEFQGKWWFQHQGNYIFDSFLEIIAVGCDYLPQSLRKPAISTIDALGLFLCRMTNIFFSMTHSYFICKGTWKETKNKISILLKGNPKCILFLTDKLCIDIISNQRISKRKGKRLWKNIADTSSMKQEMFITKTDIFFRNYYQNKGCLIIPEYVSFHLDTTISLKEILDTISPDKRRDIEKAKRTGYTYEVRSDRKAFKIFYFQMYLPYMEWKHKNSDRIASYNTIRHLAAQGSELLIIKLGNDAIFGGMFLREKNMLKTHYAALMDGKFDHLHNGIMAISYYFLIEIAKKYHCRSIDFGTAPPFLNDGLYMYKNKWGMKISKTSPSFSDVFAVKINKNDPVSKKMLTAQPVHYFQGNTLETLSHSTLDQN